MTTQAADPLFTAVEDLQQVLAVQVYGGASAWMEDVHVALGRLASAIQKEVQAAEQEVKHIGSVNQDFQDAPVTERRVEATREELITLGERVHQLRADVREGRTSSDDVRRRGQDLVNGVEKVRHAKNELLLETLNSNPGAGE